MADQQFAQFPRIGSGAHGPRGSARRSRPAGLALQFVALIWLNVGGFTASVSASELKQVTLDAFQHYVALTEDRMAAETNSGNGFLWVDQLSPKAREAALAQLRQGQVITRRLETRENGQPVPIPEGMAHHWLALVFVPGVTLAQTIAQQQDFGRSAEIYGPDIQRSKLLKADGNDFHIYYRLHRHVMIASPTYNANFDVRFFPIDGDREYSRCYSTRIAELIDAGMPNEREKPVGVDLGYVWRLNTYTRYEERDGGVYIQTEFVALSRSVPAIFAWLVNPYIRSIPQEYLVRILSATRDDLTNSHAVGTSGPISKTAVPSQFHRALPVDSGAVVNGRNY